MKGRANWPDNAAHNQIRRWIVRLWRPGTASGSGILVGPDLVLTCRHVLTKLFDGDPPESMVAADQIEISIGLSGPQGSAALNRRLRLYDDSGSRPAGPAWSVAMGPRASEDDLDFALLRLDQVVGHDAAGSRAAATLTQSLPDWLSFKDIQSPAGLAVGTDGTPVDLFMYHFPDPGNGHPSIQPMLSEYRLEGGWQPEQAYFVHGLDSEQGSSGAMVFARVADSKFPFPIAMHGGVIEGTNGEKVAVPISTILSVAMEADESTFRQLITPPADQYHRQRLLELAAGKVALARCLLDRETQASTTVDGMLGQGKRIQPLFETTADEAEKFQERLHRFDLPLSAIFDAGLRTSIRSWTLAGLQVPPPMAGEVPQWGTKGLDSEFWLRDGTAIAVRKILGPAADAKSLNSRLMLTARIEISTIDDYKLLEALLLTMANDTRLIGAEGNFLVLLWICDLAHLSEADRQQGRRAVRALWNDDRMTDIVGPPIELSALARGDLGAWEQDITGAFGVNASSVKAAVDAAWRALDQSQQADGRHPFNSVLKALDDRLQHWVYLHFRHLEETARIRR